MAAMSLRGYWRTLIVFIACKPAMRMTKLTTIASTGRLMKRSVKDVMSILLLSGERTRHRVLAMAPSPSRTSLLRLRSSQSISARAPKRAREARALPRIQSEISLFILFSRIHRRRVHLWLRCEIVVDRHRHSIAQFENSRAHDGLVRF